MCLMCDSLPICHLKQQQEEERTTTTSWILFFVLGDAFQDFSSFHESANQWAMVSIMISNLAE